MSQTVALNNGAQAIIHTDLSKIFIRDNRYDSFQYTNSDEYDPVTLSAGTLMGRIHASGKVVPLESGASDGSQFPIGILKETVTVEEGDTRDIMLCVAGDVAEDKIIFQGSDTLNTVVSSRRLRDRIGSDTVGIKLVSVTEMTSEDND
jgi:hypothetical protein